MARRSHSGQALVVMLAFMGVLTGAFVLVFNVGQTVNDKMKLVNAADAAAYSAAQWEARSLNYQAYLNRAIVANEVAIAQLVSLRSWSTYLRRTTTNVSLVAQWVPPLAAPMRALAQGWQAVDSGLQREPPTAGGGNQSLERGRTAERTGRGAPAGTDQCRGPGVAGGSGQRTTAQKSPKPRGCCRCAMARNGRTGLRRDISAAAGTCDDSLTC